MVAKVKEALRRIEDKMYESELRDGGYDSISWYRIVFCRKNCEVEVSGVRKAAQKGKYLWENI